MKCYYSFRTIKQNKSQLVSNSCGCLILLVQKKVVSFNACTFISYLNVWPFIFNVMLFMERHLRQGYSVKCFFRSISWNAYFTIVLSCKLPINVHDILFEAFHEIWKFWKSIFRILFIVIDFCIEFVFMLD